MRNDLYTLSELDEAALCSVAQQIANGVTQSAKGGVIFFRGELGAGKTTFARAFLQAFGVKERVKSPTYSLIESYQAGIFHVHHLDLYRIADPGELEWLGLADLVIAQTLLLIEWPERGAGGLPLPDLDLEFIHAFDKRHLRIIAARAQGIKWLTDSAILDCKELLG